MTAPRPTIDELVVGDEPAAWARAGFAVDDDGTCRIGSVRVRLLGRGAGPGIRSWALRDLDPGLVAEGIDGVPTTVSGRLPPTGAAHPNGARTIDHLVLTSPDGARTAAAVTAATGLDVRRERRAGSADRPVVQRFFRMGEVILELVSPAEPRPGAAAFWGLALQVDDLDATAALLGGDLGRPRPAVQEGQRIATLRHEQLGLSVAIAFMAAEAAPPAP